MAALRLFARTNFSGLSRVVNNLEIANVSPVIFQIQKREARFRPSEVYDETKNYTDYEISKDPNEWKYVERLLPYTVIPGPKNETDLPSGWKPPTATPNSYPYYIPRTKNYMQPVYLEITFRGMRRVTVIRKIQGDIWTLESELKRYIAEALNKKSIGSKVHEFGGEIKFRGDYVSLVKKWLTDKGF